MKRLLSSFSLIAALAASPASAAVALNSVDWTATGSTPVSALGGTAIFGNLTGTTGPFLNAGGVFTNDWGAEVFASGYTTSVNEGVSLGVSASSTQTQTISFSSAVSSIYLFFNFIDNGTSFDFGAYNWTLIGSTNASRSGSSMVVSGSSNSAGDGFLINVNETFGPTSGLAFDIVSTNPTAKSALFTVASAPGVPEHGGWSALAILGCAAVGARLRRRLA